jgi:putative flippase GtrA
MKEIGRISRFLVVGGTATAVQYIVLVACVRALSLAPVVASAIGFALSSVLNYYLNYRLTFRSSRAHVSALPRFLLIAGIGLIANSVAMWLLTKSAHLGYLLSQVLTTALVLIWNYTANRKWTFSS